MSICNVLGVHGQLTLVLVYIVNFKWADLLQIEIRCRLNCVHKFLSCLTSAKSSRVRSRYSFQDALYA